MGEYVLTLSRGITVLHVTMISDDDDPLSVSSSSSSPFPRNFFTNSSILDTFLGIVICIILCYSAFLLDWIQGLSDTEWKVFRLGNIILGSNNHENILSTSTGFTEIQEREVVAEVDQNRNIDKRKTDITEIETVEDGEEIHNLEIQGDHLGGGLVQQESEDNSLVKDTMKYKMFLKTDDLRLEKHLSTQTPEEDVFDMKDRNSSSVWNKKQLDTHTSFHRRENEEFLGESNVEIASIHSKGAISQENDTQVLTRADRSLDSNKAEEMGDNVSLETNTNYFKHLETKGDLMIEELTLTLVDKFTEGGQHVQISFKQSRLVRKVKETLEVRKHLEMEENMKEIVE